MEYLILVVALVFIVIGADQLVAGAVSIAKRYRVSDFVIGAAIIGIGTSLPEMVVSMIGAINGNADVAIGNVVGSNIFNVLGILGITGLLFPIAVSKANMRFEIPLCIGVSVLLMVLTFNFFIPSEPIISRIDGFLLLICFAWFMYYSFKRDGKNKSAEMEAGTAEDDGKTPLWIAILKVVIGLGVLITACHFFVDEAVAIARAWGVNDAFISITLIACGTSLPELAASIAAAMKKSTQMALGNIVGSNIFNISLILGLSSQIMPLHTGGITIVDYAVMIAAALMPAVFGGFKGKIGRAGAAFMLLCFIVYNIYLIKSQLV